MGQLLDVVCHRCGARSRQIDGAVMLGFNPRCLGCGRTRFVSLEALADSDPPGADATSEETWRLRELRIPELAGTCECGNGFSEEAPIRCLRCRSSDVETALDVMID